MNKLFSENGFAIKDCRVTVYNYDSENNEYISSTQEHVVAGSGIPARSTFVKPLDHKDGFTQIFNGENQEWQYIEDHRYDEVYNIETKQKEDIKYLGKLKPEHTLSAPPSRDHEFKGSKWILSKAKKEEITKREKDKKAHQLNSEISKLRSKMQEHIVMEENEEAKNIVLQIRELEAEIRALQK